MTISYYYPIRCRSKVLEMPDRLVFIKLGKLLNPRINYKTKRSMGRIKMGGIEMPFEDFFTNILMNKNGDNIIG